MVIFPLSFPFGTPHQEALFREISVFWPSFPIFEMSIFGALPPFFGPNFKQKWPQNIEVPICTPKIRIRKRK
jgi:hypothetical protein